MNVQVNFFTIDIPNLKEAVDFTLQDGATINTLLQACATDERVNVKYDNLKIASFLVNKVSAKIDKVLHDGDKVIILRPFAGG
jgi:molybdopterin converting factor small subunit